MFKKKSYNGLTGKTKEHLLLDAGAFFKNFVVGEDTYETAKTAGKILGATKGGGEFSAKPNIRQIEIDGVKGAAKGMEVIDSWDVSMKANLIEITKESIVSSLCAATVDSASNDDYYVIKGKEYIDDEDYTENITYVGTISGSDKPVIVQVFNSINTEGLTLATQDKSETVIAAVFKGHYAEDDENPPFAIYYPKEAPAAEQTSGTETE